MLNMLFDHGAESRLMILLAYIIHTENLDCVNLFLPRDT